MEGTNDDYKKQSEYKNLTHKFDKMMRALYGQRGAQLDIDILASDEAQSFINAHAGILDSTFKQVRMTDKMRERLTRSNYIFSGIKTFHELNEAFPSLLDENGDRKPFERFLNDVRKIDETYNANYLHAEYNFVQASAEMAAKWEQYSEDGDRYLLQYRTAHDDKVRPEHAALDRITLPMGDPFWESYYPPNGWNCFVAGTPVLTMDGWKGIESIKKGDLVIGGSGKVRKVIGTHARTVDDELFCVITKGAMATCTPNHRFYTPHGWVEARSLHKGDIIIQVGENSTLHLVVHAIANTRTLLRYGLMACVRKWKAIASLAVNDKVDVGNEKVNDVTSKKLSRFEWKAYCRQVVSYDFLAFAQWCTECAHALWVKPASGKGMLQRLRLHVRAKKGRARFQLLSYATNEVAVGLGLTLAYMETLGGKLMVGLRKSLARFLSSVGVVYPLSSDRLTTMSDGNAKVGKEAMHGSTIDVPMGTKPSETALLCDVPVFCGIKDIHAFDGFNSFFDFLRNTFFHNRYVLVEGKVTKKKRETTVYNLSIFKDESYIVPIGITHNCRCTVVQVRRGKYEETPHNEAMSRGEEVLNGEKLSIFRFNSGKQGKTMPDYNPYTIKRCNDCDVAKGKLGLVNEIVDNQLCAACQCVRNCQGKGSYTLDDKFGERLKISNLADKTEVKENTRAAHALLSSFPNMGIQIRKHVFEDGVKNPEYLINEKVADRKGIEFTKGIQSGFKKAIKQGCSVVVIDLDMHMREKKLPVSSLAKFIDWRSSDFKAGIIEECYIIYHDKAVLVDKSHNTREKIKAEIEKLKP